VPRPAHTSSRVQHRDREVRIPSPAWSSLPPPLSNLKNGNTGQYITCLIPTFVRLAGAGMTASTLRALGRTRTCNLLIRSDRACLCRRHLRRSPRLRRRSRTLQRHEWTAVRGRTRGRRSFSSPMWRMPCSVRRTRRARPGSVSPARLGAAAAVEWRATAPTGAAVPAHAPAEKAAASRV
jgi:hypothetical protein